MNLTQAVELEKYIGTINPLIAPDKSGTFASVVMVTSPDCFLARYEGSRKKDAPRCPYTVSLRTEISGDAFISHTDYNKLVRNRIRKIGGDPEAFFKEEAKGMHKWDGHDIIWQKNTDDTVFYLRMYLIKSQIRAKYTYYLDGEIVDIINDPRFNGWLKPSYFTDYSNRGKQINAGLEPWERIECRSPHVENVKSIKVGDYRLSE